MTTLIGLYDDPEAAQQAMLDLSSEGFDRRHITTNTRAREASAKVTVTTTEDRVQQASKLLWQNGPTDVRREEGQPPEHGPRADRGEDGAVGSSRPTANAVEKSGASGQMRPAGKGGPAASELFREHEPSFREHFRSHGGSSETYDEYRQAYMEGTRLGTDFQSRDWSEVEQEARRRWEHNQHPQPWSKVRDYVKHGWGAVDR
ncbi:hypothetical protein FIV42_02255 [Persicimonas caeni]|uniref:Uncharacterized protein n=1 Tax=Persicimonas caeni TaxID=2292766 RepID=A0A4Y6PMT6_PERCE|nr:general stress protein [Persicimonas caeni]QDG49601.1 hypothetical protein FIV42_02255 [Persicimonas caeni]QED30822.1 hypothetical protein FRD00_02250 [Persicimonas caeni]